MNQLLTEQPRHCRVALRYIAALCLVLAAGSASAFKISTHVWIADHFIAELGDGQNLVIRDINDQSFETVTLPTRVADSIRAFPETFRLATTGADIYPDLVAGQMTMHPGLPFQHNTDAVPDDVTRLRDALGLPERKNDPGWQTDDWLQHVRDAAFNQSPPGAEPTAQIAFAYGYLLHAAMDTWAHSYVNMLTGDLFSIMDNPTIAARHTALESFFKQAHERPRIGLRPDAAPAWFVRQNLILNAEAAEQYSRSAAASHLYAMYAWWWKAKDIRSRLVPIRRDIDRALAPARTAFEDAEGVWQSLDAQRDTAVTAASKALGVLNTAETAVQDAIDEVQKETDRAVKFLQTVPGIAQALAAADGAIKDFLSYLPPQLADAYAKARATRRTANRSLKRAQTALKKARKKRDELVDEVATAAADVDIKRTALQGLDLARNSAWTAADSLFLDWQKNIEAAVDAYVLAFEETGRRIMQPPQDRFQTQRINLEPVQRWAACWGPAFGLPLIPQLHDDCAVILANYNELRARLSALLNTLVIPGKFEALRAQIVALDEMLQEALADGLALVGTMIGRAVPNAVDGGVASGGAAFASTMWDQDVQLVDLQRLFAEDGSSAGLPLYGPGELIAVLQSDGLPLALTQDPRTQQPMLSPGKADFDDMMAFTPFANAVNLSKLALLDGEALNMLHDKRRALATDYKPRRRYGDFYKTGEAAGAILLGAIRSIDGNHQWQAVAPALPGALQNLERRATSTNCQRFGYQPKGQRYPTPAVLAAVTDDDGNRRCRIDDAGYAAHQEQMPAAKRGLHLWDNPLLRQTLFNCIFKGPLSKGICDRLPEAERMAHGCTLDPFPPSSGRQDDSTTPACILAAAQEQKLRAPLAPLAPLAPRRRPE